MKESAIDISVVSGHEQQKEWDEFITQSAVGSVQQCVWWTEPLGQLGVKIHVLSCRNGKHLVGGALLRSVPIPLTRMYITECLSGPVFSEWHAEWADAFVRGIQEVGKAVSSVTLSIKGCQDKEVHRTLIQAFARQGMMVTQAPGVLEAVLSLENRTLEDLWKHFQHGTKYSVKKGLAGKLRIERLTTGDQLRKAYESWMATAKRQRFSRIRAWTGVEPVLRRAIESGVGEVFASFVEDRLLASAFVTYMGQRASYVYGGYMDGAASYSPTHVLQYVAIQEALSRGMTSYTFGELNEDGCRTGVDQFKFGFGAVPHRNLDAITWERRPLYHRLISWFRSHSIGERAERYLMRRRRAYAQL